MSNVIKLVDPTASSSGWTIDEMLDDFRTYLEDIDDLRECRAMLIFERPVPELDTGQRRIVRWNYRVNGYHELALLDMVRHKALVDDYS